jgi:tetratricopeptide (TPR) repeat protein
LVVIGAGFGAAFFVLRPAPLIPAEGNLDAVALAYLRTEAVSHPGQLEPALQHSRALLAVGALAEAAESLAALPAAQRSAPAARVLEVQIEAAQWRARPLSDARREPAREALIDRLDALSQEKNNYFFSTSAALDEGELGGLAALALELERPALSARFQRLRARTTRQGAAEAWAAAGVASLAAREPEQAAEEFARAAALEADPVEAMRLARQALDAAVAAGPSAARGDVVAEISGRFDDPGVWSLAAAAARAIEDLPRARAVLRRWAASQPDAAEPQRHWVDLELAAGDALSALAPAVRLVELERSAANRRRLARIAEWSGQPELAIRQWAALGREDTVAADRAVELAQQLWDVETVANVLAARADLLDWGQTEKLADALEHLGRPESAEQFIAKYAAQHPADRSARLRFVALQERQGELSRALATVRLAKADLGADAALASTEAELLWRLHQPEEALAALRQVSARPADARFWSLFADLAWKSDRSAEALSALRELWALAPGPTVARRLVRLAHEAGERQLTAQMGAEAWRQYGDADSLLLAIEAELSLARPDSVRQLLAEVSADPKLASDERLLLLRSRAATAEGDLRGALAEAERALSVAPHLRAARLAWLDAALSLRDRQALPARLAAWRPEALRDAGYHRSFATAFEMLGDDEEALRWRAREAAAAPRDPFAQIGYGAALRRAGREAEALSAEEKALAELQKPGAGGTDCVLAAAWLHERLRGAESARPGVEALLGDAGGDPRVQAFAVGWHLRRGDRLAAATWLEAMRRSGTPLGRARLELAMASGDRSEIEAAADDGEIGPRAWAAAQLGDERRALQLSEKGLRGSVQEAAEVRPLVAQLRRQLSPALRADAEASRIGDLSMRGGVAAWYAGHLLDWDVEARAAARELSGPLPASSVSEVQLAAETGLELGGVRFSAAAGGSERDKVWVPSGTVAAQLRSGEWAGARAELSTGQLAEESAELRLGAWKTRAAAEVHRTFAGVNRAGLAASAATWRAPSGEQLGRGLFLEGQIARPLRETGIAPWLLVTASASRAERARTPAAAALSTFLPPWGLTSGAALIFGRGDPRNSENGAGIEAQLWAGWLFHEKRAGYLARLEASLPVASGLELGAGVSFADGSPGFGSAGRQSIYLRVVQRLDH